MCLISKPTFYRFLYEIRIEEANIIKRFSQYDFQILKRRKTSQTELTQMIMDFAKEYIEYTKNDIVDFQYKSILSIAKRMTLFTEVDDPEIEEVSNSD